MGIAAGSSSHGDDGRETCSLQECGELERSRTSATAAKLCSVWHMGFANCDAPYYLRGSLHESEHELNIYFGRERVSEKNKLAL